MSLSSTDGGRIVTVRPEELREGMQAWKTGTTIVTAMGVHGEPVGLVCNSFTSVSLDPPLVSWCVDRKSSSIESWSTIDAFSVHILKEGQQEWITRFAKRGAGKFRGIEAPRTSVGSPALDLAGTRMDCVLTKRYDGGDHLIMLGEVHTIENR
ncbi:flavin reductase family protein [Paeniglutamicibacter sp. NPDC091659]|uniref:flavin reductase family protein n=1 Tax=Paeniglutamicibacter sp. NPDC091659 TaxID=3364389 RepID=UPI003818E7C4